MTHWLDVVLPADLYVRSAASVQAGDSLWFSPEQLARIATLPGIARMESGRSLSLQLDPAKPSVTLITRPLNRSSDAGGGAGSGLPLLGNALPTPAGMLPVYVSEAFVDLYGARPGDSGLFFERFPLNASAQLASAAINSEAHYFVAGVWRDYARQNGTVAMDQADYQRLSGDLRANDLQIWLAPGAASGEVEQRVRGLIAATGGDRDALEFASAGALRATSLSIFDRSFAVTTWLQAVAIAMGLLGVAASFGAQVLARRREFGLLAHLGLTRRQILALVACEGGVWTLLGALAGVALGLAVSVVLVKVVNPQSFHWSMELVVPWWHLLALGLSVIAAGTATAWLSGRAAAGRDAIMAVKEDW